jgi:3-hydroxyacyl-[acyl-carrier-protein] dehydratase
MEENSTELALAFLPHGPEFRFVDRLLELERGKRGVGEYEVKPAAEFLRGHFPGYPIMPGVLMLEALAQVAGTVAQSDPSIAPLADLRLTAIRGAKILGTASPGQRLRMEVEIIARLGNLIQARGTVTVGGQKVVEAELVLSGQAS